MAFGSLSVKGRALRYLAQREHSRHELEGKLLRQLQRQAQRQAHRQAQREAQRPGQAPEQTQGSKQHISRHQAPGKPQNATDDGTPEVTPAIAPDMTRDISSDVTSDITPSSLKAAAVQQIAQALDELTAAGLLSDSRAAASILHSQGARHGVRRLRQTLQLRGVDPELIQSTLQQARSTELARAREVWRRRFGSPPVDAADRARQIRFLMARGFELDVIRRVVQGGGDWDAEDS